MRRDTFTKRRNVEGHTEVQQQHPHPPSPRSMQAERNSGDISSRPDTTLYDYVTPVLNAKGGSKRTRNSSSRKKSKRNNKFRKGLDNNKMQPLSGSSSSNSSTPRTEIESINIEDKSEFPALEAVQEVSTLDVGGNKSPLLSTVLEGAREILDCRTPCPSSAPFPPSTSPTLHQFNNNKSLSPIQKYGY